jgi:Zn-dependent peptidase ImmA (M78 family)
LIVELLLKALEVVDFPDHNLPRLRVGSNPELINADFIERVAQQLRGAWGIGTGPIQNVVWLLENHGVVVVRDQVATNNIDAFSCWRGSLPIMMLSSNRESAVRSRWDAAHELGHLVLHREIDPLRLSDKESLRKIERQADLFAGSFLLPRATFERSIIIPSLDEFLQVKPQWKVSVQAQIQRCAALGMISESTQQRMWKQIRARGWTVREPLDDELQPEEPELLKRSIEIGLEDGDLNLQQMAVEIGYPVEKVQWLLNTQGIGAIPPSPSENLLIFPEARPSHHAQ